MKKQNNKYKKLTLSLACVGIFTQPLATQAQSTTISYDRGWYTSDGFHGLPGSNDPSNDNYIAGNTGSAFLYRDFFVFDISTLAVGDMYTGATLNLYVGLINTAASTTFQLWDYTGSISDLVAGTGGISAYNDLGSGASYGSTTFSNGDGGTTISTDLNSNALAAINAARGGQFAVGGSVPSATVGGPTSYIFANSGSHNPADGKTSLTLTRGIASIPEPSTWAMLLAGGAGLFCFRRRKVS